MISTNKSTVSLWLWTNERSPLYQGVQQSRQVQNCVVVSLPHEPHISAVVVAPDIARHHLVWQSPVSVPQRGEQNVPPAFALHQNLLHLVFIERNDEHNLDSLLTINLSPPLVSRIFSLKIFFVLMMIAECLWWPWDCGEYQQQNSSAVFTPISWLGYEAHILLLEIEHYYSINTSRISTEKFFFPR